VVLGTPTTPPPVALRAPLIPLPQGPTPCFALPPNARFKMRNITKNILSPGWRLSRNTSHPFRSNLGFFSGQYPSVSSGPFTPTQECPPFPRDKEQTRETHGDRQLPVSIICPKNNQKDDFSLRAAPTEGGGRGWGAGPSPPRVASPPGTAPRRPLCAPGKAPSRGQCDSMTSDVSSNLNDSAIL